MSQQTQIAMVAVIAVVVIGAAIGGAYAFGVIGGDDDVSAINNVPDSDTTAVASFDGEVFTDETTTMVLDAMIEAEARTDEEPQSLDEALEMFSDESGVDMDGFNDAMMFVQEPDDQQIEQVGVIMDTEWDEDEFIGIVEEESELQEDEYNGYTVYEDDFGDTIGVLDADGVYVIGDRSSVEDAIDVHAGDADSLSGDLRDSYDNEEDGLIKFAAEIPDEDIVPPDPNQQFDVNVFNNVNTVTGVYYTQNDDIVFHTSMVTDTEEEATDVYDVSNGALSMVRGSADDPEIEDVVNAITIEHDGNTVSVEYRSDANDIVEAIEEVEDQQPQQP